MKTFQLPTKDSTQALVKSYTFDLSPVDAVWCTLFTPWGWMKTKPRIIQTHRLLFCTCFTNATQITVAPERPEAPALLPVFLTTLTFCNAQRWIGIHWFVLGFLSDWFVLWFLFVLPIGAAEQTWSQILFSTLYFRVFAHACLYCSVVSFFEATEPAQVNLYQVGKASWMVFWHRSVTEWTLSLVRWRRLHAAVYPALKQNVVFLLPPGFCLSFFTKTPVSWS